MSFHTISPLQVRLSEGRGNQGSSYLFRTKYPTVRDLKQLSYSMWRCGGQRSEQGSSGPSLSSVWPRLGHVVVLSRLPGWAGLKEMCPHRKTSSRQSSLHMGSLSKSQQVWSGRGHQSSSSQGEVPVKSHVPCHLQQAVLPPRLQVYWVKNHSHPPSPSLCSHQSNPQGHLTFLAASNAIEMFACSVRCPGNSLRDTDLRTICAP